MTGGFASSRIEMNEAAVPRRIVVVGGSGVVGFPVVDHLIQERHEVTVLSRCVTPPRVPAGAGLATWDPQSGVGLAKQLTGADAVVHLARSPLPTRWTRDARNSLFATRLGMVRRMVEAIASLETKPSVFVCGSSHDFYGRRQSEIPLSEDEPSGTDVLARLYLQIEAEALRLRSCGVRVVLARIGVCLGPRTSNPRWIQHMVADPRGALSWVHVTDCARMLRLALECGIDGPVNVTAEKSTTAVAIAEHFRRQQGSNPSRASALRAIFQQSQPTTDLRTMKVATPEAEIEEHVDYQPHWVYPTVMKKLQYRWQVPNVEDALG
jgi:NAD dependent epimerase/dehydratase family enzyme